MDDSIVVVGGGPGGLFLATLLARAGAGHRVTVYERNARTDAFGFGVVFSDATLRGIDAVDPVLRDALAEHGMHWDRIEVLSDGQSHGFAGNGMAAIHRKTLLRILQENAQSTGVEIKFGTEAPPIAELAAEHRLVVGADGTNSAVRDHLQQRTDLGHTVTTASAKFIWFATEHVFDGLTFLHRASEHGAFAVHAYPISESLSTFIVETDPDTWARAGMDAFDVTQPPGPSDTASQEYLTHLFADDIGGAALVANNSRWASFRTRRTEHWWDENVVLLGDAVHTAHFSVGSGTKMAMEDAIELANQLAGDSDLSHALAAYEAARKPAIARIQDAAGPSLAWWERFGQYQRELDSFTFAFHFFSRTIAIDKIEQRDPALAAEARQKWVSRHGTPPLRTPLQVASRRTAGRVLEVSSTEGSWDLLERGQRVAATGDGGSIAVVRAPDRVEEVSAAADRLPAAGAVMVVGGSALTRTLLSEEARLNRGLTSIIVDDQPETWIETTVLAGRADAVARPVVGSR